MDLIVSHANADFDALGSVIAAKKLYPHSRLLLPGSPERAVREFLSIFRDVIRVETEGECSLDGIKRLIVVDTRHKSRIGVAARLVDEKGIVPVIYDHHPRTPHDMAARPDIHEELGATVTILLNIINRKRARISPIEATIMLLGIYEETGSLTYRTTTRKDVDAVSYLLSQGARLNMVSSYLKRELGEEELAFLVRLINSTHMYDINGVKVAICVAETVSYSGELGTIIHKLIDVENLKVVFLLLKGATKVHVIARSHIQDIDVNMILRHFGGAGHSAAASGKVAGADIEDIRERLKDAPELEAKTIFDHLVEEYPGQYESGQLRTLQRRVGEWRATEGPEQELFFPQAHRPGEAMQTDFTWGTELGITILGEAFPHMLCHPVLPYSNWEWATVCRSESLSSLKRGVQEALFSLGKVPVFHQTDNSTAATHDLKTGKRGFNEEYAAVMRHLNMKPRTIAVGKKEQNGDVEALNGALKRRIKQHLLLRGSRDFETLEQYEEFAATLTQPQLRALRSWRNPRTNRYEAPKKTTLWRIAAGVEAELFEQTVNAWLSDADMSLEAIAIDGKALRATLNNEDGGSFAAMVPRSPIETGSSHSCLDAQRRPWA